MQKKLPLTLAETTSIPTVCFCFSTTSVFKKPKKMKISIGKSWKVGYYNHQDFRGYDVITFMLRRFNFRRREVKPRMSPPF